MIKESFQQKMKVPTFGEGEHKDMVNKSQLWRAMDHPELSLGPTLSVARSLPSLESETNLCRKRKSAWNDPMIQTSIELQHKDPLPLDWEQCLDLQSGRMYYLNRKTLKKSWDWPKGHRLDLELNISAPSGSHGKTGPKVPEDSHRHTNYSSSNMVAVACLRCHLLVMLCKSSPSCPNCKYVHSLPLPPPTQQNSPQKVETRKTLETLSLLN